LCADFAPCDAQVGAIFSRHIVIFSKTKMTLLNQSLGSPIFPQFSPHPNIQSSPINTGSFQLHNTEQMQFSALFSSSAISPFSGQLVYCMFQSLATSASV